MIGLDGASFDPLEGLVAAGRMPHLARWLSRGVARSLPSTVPPMSFPAWSSFLTGREPGEHGLFDFTQKRAGAYRLDFVHAGRRRGASFLARASAAGRRVLALGIPATYPPEALDGLLVAGFDAPVSSSSDPRSASDPALYRRIAGRAGPWKRADLDEGARATDWHERAADTLAERVDQKTRFACAALEELARDGRPAELAVVVFSESDTVAHHYWRDHDPHSPRHDPTAGPERRDAIARVYARLDAACGELRDAFGNDALCVVLSDHGSGGASDWLVHLGGRLEACGLLQRRRGGDLSRAARHVRDAALRRLPPRAAEALFRLARPAAAELESRVRFAGHDWSRTRAFSEDANTQPGVWINLRGREARGCVDAGDYERVRDEVIDALLDWKLPGGEAVVARARRREEVYRGPHVERAPDVVVEFALVEGYLPSLVPTPWQRDGDRSLTRLEGAALAGGRGRGMNGAHRPDGLCIADGPGAERFATRATRLVEVGPALLDALGVEAVDGADGDASEADGARYSDEESARVAERLRALGYLE